MKGVLPRKSNDFFHFYKVPRCVYVCVLGGSCLFVDVHGHVNNAALKKVLSYNFRGISTVQIPRVHGIFCTPHLLPHLAEQSRKPQRCTTTRLVLS